MRKVVPYVLLAIMLSVVVVPFYWIFVSSFKPTQELIRSIPTFVPETWTFNHYQRLFAAADYGRYLLNSTLVALATMFITIILASLAAYSVYRCRYPGREFFVRMMLIIYAFPSSVLVVPIYRLFSAVGMVNHLASLVMVNVAFTAPFSVWLLRTFFRSIPMDIEEAAEVDGASQGRILWSIFLPLTAPGIATIAIFTFLTSWTEFLFANILILDESIKTVPAGLSRFITQYNVDWGILVAGAIVTALPPLVTFALVGRNFIRGLTAGSVRS